MGTIDNQDRLSPGSREPDCHWKHRELNYRVTRLVLDGDATTPADIARVLDITLQTARIYVAWLCREGYLHRAHGPNQRQVA